MCSKRTTIICVVHIVEVPTGVEVPAGNTTSNISLLTKFENCSLEILWYILNCESLLCVCVCVFFLTQSARATKDSHCCT